MLVFKIKMTKRSQTTDWFARIIAGSSLLLTLLGSYFAYHWHQQEVEDRIFVRLSATTHSAGSTLNTELVNIGQGTIEAEVVNTGMRSIYIQKVELETKEGGQPFSKRSSSIGSEATTTALEPGQTDDFDLPWDFSEHPVSLDEDSGFYRLVNNHGKEKDAFVCIQTTRALFRRPVNISDVTLAISSPSKLGNQIMGPPLPPHPPNAPTITGVGLVSIEPTKCP